MDRRDLGERIHITGIHITGIHNRIQEVKDSQEEIM